MAKSPTSIGTPLGVALVGLFIGLCLCVGVLARFAGLGKWPLAIDEYYFAQSVQNVLRVGVPQYACGGFYMRGLLLQYCSALLQLIGLSAELAPRLIAAASSLIALPAVFIVGRRMGGKYIGLIAIAIMAASVWEIEIARLGRMYAPFQALFVWYVVFFFSYTLDRRTRALGPMLALSVIGVLVWEGGVFLVVANMLPPFIRNPSGRLQRRDWQYLAATALLVVPLYWLATVDLRTLAGEPALPADVHSFDAPSQSPLDAGIMPWRTLPQHPIWVVAALLPVAAALFAAYRIVRLHIRPTAAIGMLAALACALLQQFELTAAIVLLLLLLSMIDWRELSSRAALVFPAAIAVSVTFWVAFGLGTHDWHTQPLSALHSGMLLGYQFVRFPDFVREIAIPWARAVPVLGIMLFLLVAAACVRAIARPASTPPTERLLLALLIFLLLAASASHPPRHETRYVFFLYPLAIIAAVTMITHATRAVLGASRYATVATVFLCLGAFALSEDFQPSHLWNINSAAVNFRIGMNEWKVGHYHPRSDVRAAARWLDGHVVSGRDLVVSSFPGLDFYYSRENFFFMEPTDPRFDGWSCRAGTRERWGNRPLISSVAALTSQVSADRTVWLVIEPRRAGDLAARLAQSAPTVRIQSAWTAPGRDIAVVSLGRSSGTG
jgi:hypothetical protein